MASRQRKRRGLVLEHYFTKRWTPASATTNKPDGQERAQRLDAEPPARSLRCAFLNFAIENLANYWGAKYTEEAWQVLTRANTNTSTTDICGTPLRELNLARELEEDVGQPATHNSVADQNDEVGGIAPLAERVVVQRTTHKVLVVVVEGRDGDRRVQAKRIVPGKWDAVGSGGGWWVVAGGKWRVGGGEWIVRWLVSGE